ncbi:hypothetical protein AWC38_SpisGene22740 [Stylophora pistillata]|uniref:HAT C-terminal dimerisation domain-containing protein n=1 Tax=Stylophora pistillata TaxID=50429 RepID=A0A2B4R8P9_STYPI|nr:hypothetical protein AWC38_SpisGene22740 [Stylophora pistillata]
MSAKCTTMGRYTLKYLWLDERLLVMTGLQSREAKVNINFFSDATKDEKIYSEETAELVDEEEMDNVFHVDTKYNHDGAHLRKVNDKDAFCEHPLKGTDVAFKAARSQLITDLISSLEKKFSDTTRGIFQATHIAKISSWPSAKTAEIENFGDQELQVILAHYGDVLQSSDVVLENVESEWTSLKAAIYDEHEAAHIPKLTWSVINRKYSDNHQNILAVIDLVLALPASSAEVERGFSQLKILKSDIRSTLSEERLNDLLAVKLLSADITIQTINCKMDLIVLTPAKSRSMPGDDATTSFSFIMGIQFIEMNSSTVDLKLSSEYLSETSCFVIS